jgi:hypothetical protein
MNDRLEYIDQYFKGHLDQEELALFDKRVVEDPEFASEVSFYITSVNALQQEVNVQRKQRFREIYSARKVKTINYTRYIAAAAVIAGVVLGMYLLYPAPSTTDIAQKYINQNLSTLGVMMTSNRDSIQDAINLYNNGNLNEASITLESFIKSHPTDHKAIEYAGIVSLRLENFDQALQHFELLAQNTSLYANPGNFYVSLTLLKRNGPGDVQRATSLLQQIVEEHGAKENAARELLKQL